MLRKIHRHRFLTCLTLCVLSSQALRESPGRAADGDFPRLINTENPESKLTTAADALKGITLPEGFRVTLFAAEPDINQPIALATDDRGRLWVAENYTYAERPRNFDDRMRDRVVILEDTDHDGSFDKRTVFWDQGRRLTSVELGYGGVWVLDAPNLLFIPDRDGDDVPDGEPIVMLDGWDDEAIRHNIVNGLRWGPDGWLYGRHGIMATSLVGRPGATPDQRTSLNCCVWKFHPTKRTFEVVCEGTTNSWGMDWDENGELFFINTVIGHLWHAIPGSYFRRMYGEHFNPHVYQSIEQTADHFHWDTKEQWHEIRNIGVSKTTDQAGGGHAHAGMVIVPPGLWSTEYDSSVLTINLHGRRINRDRLVRDGATYVGKHADDLIHVADPWFRGVELHFGPNGTLYIADWSDVGECHENDGVHRTSGRIYQVSPEVPARTVVDTRRIAGLAAAGVDQLVQDACSTHPWLASHARRLLAERVVAGADLAGARKQLATTAISPAAPTPVRLSAVWSLYATGGVDVTLLGNLLHDPSENVRVWAVRILAENGRLSTPVAEALTMLASNEKSGLVLTYLASILNRISHEQRWPIARNLVKHGEFARDRVFPLMVWYGIEPALLLNSTEAIEFARSSRLPLVREFVARRMTEEIERKPEAVAQLVELLGDGSASELARHDILHGMTDALRGWRKAPQPDNWRAIAMTFDKSSHSDNRRLVRELSLVFGDGRALDELRTIARNGDTPLEERRSAIRALVLARDEKIVEYLQNLLTNRDLAKDAINGLAAFGNKETPLLLVSNFGAFRNDAKREAINTLVSRPIFASVLLDAVARKNISRSEVSAFQLRQMQSYGEATITDRVGGLWPELEQLSREKTARIAELRGMLTPETLAEADTSAGRWLFSQSCANCHTLFGEGRKIAPDLTGAQRINLNYLLENIVDPSATVSKNFKMAIVLLDDGRVFNGVVLAQNEKTITLQTAIEQVAIQRTDIDVMRESNLSMMPENLLNVLKDKQIRDLIGYLMSPTQVSLPKDTNAD
ncbi:MAG: c-type cytochrome [Planctomycetota bacterium]|nr:c-type cytochrome [Planctomycetota bacterium]MDA1163291.1 c-type cytochrome [Planctomycetota bacterium]